jgi:hypothetical protein
MAARVGHVRIGAGVQQHRGQIEIGVEDCDAERRRAIGNPIVDVSALLQQELDCLRPVVAHGEEQRRVAALRALVQLRTELEQQLGGVGVAFARGEHQRRLPAEGFRQANLRAALQQRAHRSDAAVAGRGHQRRLSFFGCRIGIGTGSQQPLDERRVAILRGQRQRGDLVASDAIGLRAGTEQRVQHGQVVAMHRPVHGSRAIRRRLVRISAALEQRTDGVHIAVPGGVHQSRAVGGEGHRRAQQSERNADASNDRRDNLDQSHQ